MKSVSFAAVSKDAIGIPFIAKKFLPYMEQIKLLTALDLSTRNYPIMSTFITLQVSNAAALYKECNLTVVWKKNPHRCKW